MTDNRQKTTDKWEYRGLLAQRHWPKYKDSALYAYRVNCVPLSTIHCKISDFCLCCIFLVFYVKFHWEIVDDSSRNGLLNTIKHRPQCKETN